MIPIRDAVEVAAPPSQVWPLLADPHLVVTCIPGAALLAQKGPDLYEFTFDVRFGAVTAKFRGEATVKYDDAGRSCRIETRCRDQRGTTSVKASTQMTVTGAQATHVAIDGGFDVAGPLATFARTGGVHVAREMLAQFAVNLAGKLAGAGSEAPVGPAAPSSAGPSLFWRAFVAWLRDLFGRWSRRNHSPSKD